jgi:hypothetical protein
MSNPTSKSALKARAMKDRYNPDPMEALKALRGTVLRYDNPLEPVGVEDWEALR